MPSELSRRVSNPGDEGELIFLAADQVEIVHGALVGYELRGDVGNRYALWAFAPGEWHSHYAASIMDDSPVSWDSGRDDIPDRENDRGCCADPLRYGRRRAGWFTLLMPSVVKVADCIVRGATRPWWRAKGR